MKKRKIVIGSRGSKLALIYAQNAKNMIIQKTDFHQDDIVIREITTKGDQFQNVRLSEFGGKGLFISNIESQLQAKNIDIAVHALKDMPAQETKDLNTNAFLKRNDPREILITIDKKKLKELKNNAIIGTSSYRREFQIKKIRRDLNCKLLRGNVDTRIKKLNDGLFDAIILSYAGVKSLKMDDKIAQIFSTNEIIPSAGQGIIALQCRSNDDEIISILDKINDNETFQRAQAERNVLKVLEGDCETAVGVHSIIQEDQIILEAELFSLDGKERFYEKKSSKVTEAHLLGIEIGEKLKKKSANTYKK
ncbi:MAG: hydroxymethylbilane synthase [Alphaproteobacteria bacterium]|nr:hydroxymethylbilane synthase [Alphaproteobacteria bacterium]